MGTGIRDSSKRLLRQKNIFYVLSVWLEYPPLNIQGNGEKTRTPVFKCLKVCE